MATASSIVRPYWIAWRMRDASVWPVPSEARLSDGVSAMSRPASFM